MSSLVERLGYSADARLLIVNCDDLGSSSAANRAIADVFARGTATSATLMVPCPWALDAVRRAKGGGVGVHLTLTCEYPGYCWRALTGADSLHDHEGVMRRTAQEVWDNADLADVEAECRAQIDQAYTWGVEVTHLDAHMGTMQLEPRYHAIFLRLAQDYDLPVRMFGGRMEAQMGFPARAGAIAAGRVFPDHLIDVWKRPRWETLSARISALRPGVTEVFFHPVEDGPELRDYDLTEAEFRVGDYACLTDPAFPKLLADSGVELISFAPLRELQRSHG